MSEQDNIKVVEAMYEAFGKGDMEGLLAHCSDGIVWEHPRGDKIPWGGVRNGHEGVIEFFTKVNEAGDIQEFNVEGMAAGGEVVFVAGNEKIKVKSTGKEYAANWVHKFTLKDGKVVKFYEYADTGTIIDAFSG